MTKPPPRVFTGPIIEQPAGPRKKRTGLAIVLILVAVLCIGGAVVAVILLTGGKASMAITSPSTGSTVDGNSVKVRISLSGAGGVDKVEAFVDSEKRATIKAAPYQVTLESVDNGKHVLEASAVDANGSVLARASGTFTSHGKTDKPPDGGQTGDEGSKVYKAALASKINQASGLNARIARDADRVNTEVNFNARVIPAPLLAEIKSLNASAGSLAATANSPAPPADMKDLQSQFATLSEYLRVRADALLKGLQAVDSGGDYTAEFNRGTAAKASFDAAWPSFLTTCRSLGVPI